MLLNISDIRRVYTILEDNIAKANTLGDVSDDINVFLKYIL